MKSLLRLASVCLRKYVGIGFQPEIQPEIFCRGYRYFTSYGMQACGNDLIKKLLYKIKGRKFLTTMKHTDYYNWTYGSVDVMQEVRDNMVKQVKKTIKGVEE